MLTLMGHDMVFIRGILTLNKSVNYLQRCIYHVLYLFPPFLRTNYNRNLLSEWSVRLMDHRTKMGHLNTQLKFVFQIPSKLPSNLPTMGMWVVPFGSIHGLKSSTFPYSFRGTLPSLAGGGTYISVCHLPNTSNGWSLITVPFIRSHLGRALTTWNEKVKD